MPIVDTLKVFVGAKVDERGNIISADTDELRVMGEEAKKRGFLLGGGLWEITNTIKMLKPARLEVEGGMAGICVRRVVETALNSEAEEVTVNLSRIRTSHFDEGLSQENKVRALEMRRKALVESLGNKMAKDQRLKITS